MSKSTSICWLKVCLWAKEAAVMQGDGVVLSVLNPNTVSVLIFVLFVIDKDEYLFHARVLCRSKAQADGIELSSPNLKHKHTHTYTNTN